MKRFMILIVIATFMLNAYELGTDNRNSYTVFDPAERAMGMTYPKSWVSPDSFLQHPQYQDSSMLFISWKQFFTSNSDLSNNITAQYIPYSDLQRWSLGLNHFSYNGSNPSEHNDVNINFKYKKGMLNAYHTDTRQTFKLTSTTLSHKVNSNAITFDHRFGKKLLVSAGLDHQVIEQEEAGIDSSANYNANHQFLKVAYPISKPLLIYGKFEHRYFQNVSRENNLAVFRPGIRYKKGIFSIHLAARISTLKFFPIAQISIAPGPLYFETYLKVRNPIFIIKQPAHQYMGIKAGVKHKTEIQSIKASVDLSYDHPTSISATSFYMLKAFTEYRIDLKKTELYFQAEYSEDFDYVHYYYHPEKASLYGGLSFHKKLGKVLIDGDINTQYILHDDPDSVSFDPVSMTYSVTPDAGVTSSWKLNFELKTTFKDLSISAIVSTPVNFREDLNWYLYEGIYTSSDFLQGNTLYAGINVSWLWWK